MNSASADRTNDLPFLLVPGLGGQLDGYDEMKQAWAERVPTQNASAPELITMGFDNQRPLHRRADYFPLFEELAPKDRDFVIIANSFGSQRAYEWVLETRPANLKAMIFLSGFLGCPHRGLTRVGASWLFQGWHRYPNRPAIAAAMHKWRGPGAVEGMRRQIEQGARPTSAVMRARVRMMRRQPTRLPALFLPTLIVQSEDDMLLHPPSAANLVKSLPNAKVVRLPGPHFIPQAHPDLVVREIDSFLKEQVL